MYTDEKSQRSQHLIYTAAEADIRIVHSLLFPIEDGAICTMFVDYTNF